MAIKNFNEILREREEKANRANDGVVHLDDESRVKVLSPMQLIIKRFMRNKLAIVGLVILLAMFFFSFLGPFFSPYGESEIFYVDQVMNLPYAAASAREQYTIFNKDEAVTLIDDIRLNVTTTAKKLNLTGAKIAGQMASDGQLYLYDMKDAGIEAVMTATVKENLPILSFATATPVCAYLTFGGTTTVNYETDAAESADADFDAAMRAAVAANQASFVYGDVTYMLQKPNKLQTNILRAGTVEDGVLSGELPEGADAEAYRTAVATATAQLLSSIPTEAGGNDNFQLTSVGTMIDGTLYLVQQTEEQGIKSKTSFTVTAVEAGELLAVCTNYVVDGVTADSPFVNVNINDTDATKSASAAVKKALFAFVEGEENFTLGEDGMVYSFTKDEADNIFIDRTAQDSEDAPKLVALFNNFTVRRQDGTDTVPFAVKQMVAAHAEQILADKETNQANAATEVTFAAPLPVVDGEGKFMYDEDGEYVTADADITVVLENNAFVVRADQTKYILGRYQPISSAHWLGTDNNGMDVLTRMMYGGRVSLLIGFIVVLIELVLGVILGGLAGYFGGWVDMLIMRLVDVFNCIPSMPILLILGSMFDAVRMAPGMRLVWLMVILGILGWSGVARLVRGQILSLREQEFMTATEATGIRVSRRIFRHLVPNVMPQLIVTATTGLGGVILTESTLSFLGLGVKHPMATWGSMINLATGDTMQILNYAYIWIPVGVLICLTVVAFNFVGDGLRDAFDPKMKR